jgi:hypothetical protein
MENPATWKRAEVIICDTLAQCTQDAAAGVIGLSRPRMIADALREAGLLDDADEPEQGPEAAFGHREPRPVPPPYTEAPRRVRGSVTNDQDCDAADRQRRRPS